MDERLRVFLWIAGGGAFFAVLGAGLRAEITSEQPT